MVILLYIGFDSIPNGAGFMVEWFYFILFCFVLWQRYQESNPI